MNVANVEWRAVVSPSHPDSVFLFNNVTCYRLIRSK